MKKSPFTLLKEWLESDRYNQSLQMQKLMFCEKKSVNHEFVIGYCAALEQALNAARYIAKYHERPPF